MSSSTAGRLARQMQFLVEIDKVKQVFRRTYLMDKTRKENDAEHMWHFAVMAVVLAEYASEDIDLARVVQMALIHDLVEIDAGDTFAYDTEGMKDKADREQAAAERIFGLLPEDQGRPFRSLWEEFEAAETPDARFARALDRFHPMLHNLCTGGAAWAEHNVTADRVIERNEVIADGAPALWEYARALLDEAVARGDLAPGPAGKNA